MKSFFIYFLAALKNIYICLPEGPHLSDKAHTAEEHFHKASLDTHGTLEYSPLFPDPHIVPKAQNINEDRRNETTFFTATK